MGTGVLRHAASKGEVRAARAVVGGAIAFAALAWSEGAQAYGVKHTPSGAAVRWSESSVTFHVDASVKAATDGARDAVDGAARSWSGLEGAPTIATADGGGGASPGYDGASTIFYAPTGSALAGGALAVTVLTFDATGRVLDADVVVNGRYAFAVLEANAVAKDSSLAISNEGGAAPRLASNARFDLSHVVAHEMGHALGLADESVDTSALMYLYTLPGDASRRAPASDDSAGIASLYDTGSGAASAASSRGCSGGTVSPRGPSHQASRVAFGIGLGLAGWLAVRARTRRRPSRWVRPLALGALSLVAVTVLPVERAARSSPHATAMRGDARALVTHVETTVSDAGLFTTRATVSTTECRVASCPRVGIVETLGGTLGDVHQVVGGDAAPREGEEIELAMDDAHAMRIVATP